ncbi:MAG TPA: bifunctional UDP-N-acetylglucosamine diphosphorylase/glucosamine-1-phosphate N-acetyltransferase GlmU [Selenomonadales bacterium]|nr:bifunctional UDP-N-acetylglucosamine diphosphorylase/glucosamine-1-phosphate N-acetyltransferase GlmU [Selenomonadales bacterium]
MSDFVTVIMAAGKGTRMKSTLPKVLHKVGGKPMLGHVLSAANAAGAGRNIVVIGFGADVVQETIGPEAEFVVQREQLGTGHAVLQTRDRLAGYTGTVMVLSGDTPLLQPELLARLFEAHRREAAAATVLTGLMPDTTGYGRVIRDSEGRVVKIVEQKDASPAELAVNEVNAGIYCFEAPALFEALGRITCDNQQCEYYLPDVVGLLVKAGTKVWAVAADDYQDTLGINSRRQLAEAEKILRARKNMALMDAGVTIMDPDSTFIDAEVTIGTDTVVYPFTWLEGQTSVGSRCAIGPNTRIADSAVGDDTTIHFSYAHDCRIGNGVTVGPYVHIRPQTALADKVKVGNFVEIKNSLVGEGSKVPHLSYIGDTDMGTGVNIGSGTITVNYDGKKKYRTTIEDNAFIGCNTNLVAPVKVGHGAYVAAGSTITKDVPSSALGVARARQSNIEGWVSRNKG